MTASPRDRIPAGTARVPDMRDILACRSTFPLQIRAARPPWRIMSSPDESPSPPAFPFADRADRHAVETGLAFAPKFDADGLIPVVTTDARSREVLMVAYMNAEALRRTLALGEAVYYSRSRQELWHKGATSGQIQRVVEMRVDCDQDTLVLAVEQAGGGCCHVGHPTCFYRTVDMDAARAARHAVVPLAPAGA